MEWVPSLRPKTWKRLWKEIEFDTEGWEKANILRCQTELDNWTRLLLAVGPCKTLLKFVYRIQERCDFDSRFVNCNVVFVDRLPR